MASRLTYIAEQYISTAKRFTTDASEQLERIKTQANLALEHEKLGRAVAEQLSNRLVPKREAAGQRATYTEKRLAAASEFEQTGR